MSFLGPKEEYQIEHVAQILHVSTSEIVRRTLQAALSRNETDRLFLQILAVRQDMTPHQQAAILIELIESDDQPEQLRNNITIEDTLREYVIHGVASQDYWRKYYHQWTKMFSTIFLPAQEAPPAHPSREAILTKERIYAEKPFYETATPEEWVQAFMEWAESHKDLPRLPEEAFQREYYYEDHD